ncbi:MAG: restriction endonuclease [Candidatus Doudnabacteria bacterium]|nr:restriction endonuclease [Candidatus Doudnabacteria bacterium]
MNQWVEKSIILAGEPDYLDKLHTVYPMEVSAFREIPKEILEQLRVLIESKNHNKLVKLLISLLKKKMIVFPIKDSYVAFLKENPKSIEINPQTVKRIGERVIKMGYEEMIKNSSQPKETNRQIGPLFRRWIKKLNYPILREQEFLNYRGIAFLEGSDTSLKNFSNREFKTRLKKGLDLILKVNELYVIGEAKFLTSYGGHQNAEFNDPLGLLRVNDKKVTKIAVLDGVVWIPSRNQMHSRITKEKGPAFSALLLNDYIRSLKGPQKL